MKALVKCKFYLMMLFVAVLFTVSTAASDDQTKLSTGDYTNEKKPTIMILGSGHLANPGADAFNFKMDDVLAPKRQREIEQLVQQLREFKPTKIALEIDERFDAEVNATTGVIWKTLTNSSVEKRPDWISVSKTDGTFKALLRVLFPKLF